jgi:ribonuclease D
VAKEELQKLIYNKFIAYSSSLYPTLVLTEKGLSYVDKTEEVFKPTFSFSDLLVNSDSVLYNKLVSFTNELSRRESINPVSIIDPKALRILSSVQPDNIKELELLPMISGTFIKKFGRYYINCIREFKLSNVKTANIKPKLTDSIQKAIEDIQNGIPVREAAIKAGMEPGALSKEISDLAESGLRINIKQIIDPEILYQIEVYLKKHPMAKLKDIVRDLLIDTDFATLRIVTSYVRNSMK